MKANSSYILNFLKSYLTTHEDDYSTSLHIFPNLKCENYSHYFNLIPKVFSIKAHLPQPVSQNQNSRTARQKAPDIDMVTQRCLEATFLFSKYHKEYLWLPGSAFKLITHL
jgi:hypothetical protein